MRVHRKAGLIVCLFALSSCGDGGGAILTPGDDDDDPPVNCAATECGDVHIALTDADGDFLSYRSISTYATRFLPALFALYNCASAATSSASASASPFHSHTPMLIVMRSAGCTRRQS